MGEGAPPPGSKRPQNTAFKQQQLKAWQPILTPQWVISSFFIVGIVFVPIGIACLKASQDVVEVSQNYFNTGNESPCKATDKTCTVTFKLPNGIGGKGKPAYLYYALDNFYQNHRRYVKSRSDVQLRGETPSSLADCEPMVDLSASSIAAMAEKAKGKSCKDDPQYCLNPCGLIAWSFFNDTFTVYKGPKESGAVVTGTKQGIAWPSDKATKFKNRADCSFDASGNLVSGPANCFNVESEDFIVWMRTAGLPSFRKLNRIFPDGLEAGDYVVEIGNNYPVGAFDGKKSLVLSTTTWIGGKNDFLGIAYIVIGAVCLLLGIAFLAKHLHSPRKLGDSKYLANMASENRSGASPTGASGPAAAPARPTQ
eukprot:tig00000140_g8462.t1